ncbi:MAG: dihydroorotase [Victivallaceae bacterium]|nr:dihydroorotase [Victivallaceae bacterium]NLK83560.1 dihydroorotase [Lentisphaerota bacterium]MDD3117222.1 dihydroorotase [Victivallaceae bacterium]MDD3702683.1 dihydroorotase [Victivallaceae bacterium]MDD4318686.1 dihydroorotase [Victivallaceae bacterium]
MNTRDHYILTGARVVDPARGIDEVMDIGVANGIIVEPSSIRKPEKIDLSGNIIAPGFIDIHVHLRQPGNTGAETIATGTMAAAAGGFTSILAMPNTNPCCDSAGTIELIKRESERNAKVRVYPCGCLSKNSDGKEMAGIGSLKNAGVVALSDDGRCIQNNELMRHVVAYAKSFDLPILDHCEEESLKGDGVMHEGKWSVLLGMLGIPSAAEELIIQRNIIFSRMFDWKIHMQHISTRESVEMMRRARARGIKVTAEATPHHIALTDENIKKFDTNYKMNPPLRSEDDRQAVIKGLKDGTISIIATDHAPHTMTAKEVEFDYAPFGIIGLETAIPVCLTELYHSGILSMSELVSKFTVGPATLLGLNAGTLEPGTNADITVINPDEEFVYDVNTSFSKSRNTPFHGTKFKGRAEATIVGGNFVYRRKEQ